MMDTDSITSGDRKRIKRDIDIEIRVLKTEWVARTENEYSEMVSSLTGDGDRTEQLQLSGTELMTGDKNSMGTSRIAEVRCIKREYRDLWRIPKRRRSVSRDHDGSDMLVFDDFRHNDFKSNIYNIYNISTILNNKQNEILNNKKREEIVGDNDNLTVEMRTFESTYKFMKRDHKRER